MFGLSEYLGVLPSYVTHAISTGTAPAYIDYIVKMFFHKAFSLFSIALAGRHNSQGDLVEVWLHGRDYPELGRAKCAGRFSLHLLRRRGSPRAACVRRDRSSGHSKLHIRVPSMEYVDDIEIPALEAVLEQMHSMHEGTQTHPTTCIGDKVLLYRGLQLLSLPIEAEELRATLMQQLKTQPVTADDVQNIWWAFQHTAEWSNWLDALIHNIAQFRIFDTSDGGYIEHFIQTELLQLIDAQRDNILNRYHHYKIKAEKKRYAAMMQAHHAQKFERLRRVRGYSNLRDAFQPSETSTDAQLGMEETQARLE